MWAKVILLVLMPVVAVANTNECDNVLKTDDLIVCLGSSSQRAHQALNRTYKDTVARLTKEQKALLVKSQRAWLVAKNNWCDLEASSVAGGQAYQPTYLECDIRLTQVRTKEVATIGR